jgi:hypothetical protein
MSNRKCVADLKLYYTYMTLLGLETCYVGLLHYVFYANNYPVSSSLVVFKQYPPCTPPSRPERYQLIRQNKHHTYPFPLLPLM